MRINRLWAQNFRGLKDIVLEGAKDVNVISGPNAVGKSSLLEAIRLPKSMLGPRIPVEAQQALINIGGLSPHYQAIGSPGVDIASLANDPSNEIKLGFNMQLSPTEIGVLRNSIGQISMLMLQTELGNSAAENTLGFTQYLSSQNGRKRIGELTKDAAERVQTISDGFNFDIELRMNVSDRSIRGADSFNQTLLTILDRRLATNKTLMSFFPADRAMPQGEQPIQLGSADAMQQLLSHMATPNVKYQRVKQAIIQTLLLGSAGTDKLMAEFDLIFKSLLPGKSLTKLESNSLGLLRILVDDKSTGKSFDIDFMSSGEKGLLLTFLYISLTMESGGIVLLDEPELHLNSAIQERILPFIFEHCVAKLPVQVFICTHSPEIVRDAFANSNCALYHLRSGTDLTPIMPSDQRELFEVIGRLGNSTADVLFTKGNIYVEGEHDSEIIKAGFGELVTGYKISALGGRGDVEREAPLLKKEEEKGRLRKIQLFIIDNDGNPIQFQNGNYVKVIQWSKHCIENYLIQDDILFDLITSFGTRSVESRGSFAGALKQLALTQAAEKAIREAYNEVCPPSPGLRNEDVKDKDLVDAAGALAGRLQSVKESLHTFEPSNWSASFVANAEVRRKAIETEWESTWRDRCNGKKLIDDLYKAYQINMDKKEFKKSIVTRMAMNMSDNWRVMKDILSTSLGVPPG